MSPHPHPAKTKFIVATLLLLMTLACGPLYRLQEFNRQNQGIPAATSPTGRNNELNIANAYAKTQTLPGYRFEYRHLSRENKTQQIKHVMSGEVDAWGNIHLVEQNAEGQRLEIYIVDKQVYELAAQYQGWILPGTDSTDSSDGSPAPMPAGQTIIQLTTQAGTIPVEVKPAILSNRPTMRYALADTLQTGQSPVDLRGTLWVDTQTGALIKSELFLYRNSNSLPSEEFTLAITDIGAIETIKAPVPLIDPIAAQAAAGAEATAVATATAQTQQALPAKMTYRGEIVKFEVAPVRVTYTRDSSPRQALVSLRLNRLPGDIFLEESLDPFLAQLREQLTLSIPEQNLVVTSMGYRLTDRNAINRTINVVYIFNADLENLGHIELILAGPGNPLFVPVPVE